MSEANATEQLVDIEDALSYALTLIAKSRQIIAETSAGESTSAAWTIPGFEIYDPVFLSQEARRLINDRDERQKFVPSSLLGEPVWDMLLDLFSREVLKKPTSVSSACVASRVPPTTALRYVTLMEKNGLIQRFDSEEDKRVTYLKLAPETYRSIALYIITIGKVRHLSTDVDAHRRSAFKF